MSRDKIKKEKEKRKQESSLKGESGKILCLWRGGMCMSFENRFSSLSYLFKNCGW